MRIAIAELLAFTYNLEYLLRLTKLKYTHIEKKNILRGKEPLLVTKGL